MRKTLKFTNIPILGAFLAMGALMGITSTSVQADINDGVIAGWTFDDGKVTDAVGKNHGKLTGGAKIVDKGKFGKALDVDGVKAYAEVMTPDLEKTFEKAFSVSYWLLVRNGRNHSGVWKGNMVGWGDHFTFRMVTTGGANFTWGVTHKGEECWFATDGILEPGKWVHLCQTVDGKQAIGYITKEGEKKPTIPPSGQQNPRACAAPYNIFPDKPIEMGRGVGIGGNLNDIQYLDGVIDDVIIWNRPLTEAEVTELGQGKRPEKALAVQAYGKLATTWGKVKSYNSLR